MKPENQPTPPEGYEIISPEIARMRPEGMKILPHGGEWYLWPNEQIKDLDKAINHYAETGCFFSAPLGTTAMLTTPGPEVGECDCENEEVRDAFGMDFVHGDDCPAHPRNAYVKVLPGWLAGLKEKPEGLRWKHKAARTWEDCSDFVWSGITCPETANLGTFAYAIPRHVYDAIEVGRKDRPWSTDPIHDEVAKMPEEKLMGDRPFYPLDDPQHPVPRDGTEIEGKWQNDFSEGWTTNAACLEKGWARKHQNGYWFPVSTPSHWRPISPLAANHGAGEDACTCHHEDTPSRPAGPCPVHGSPAPAAASGTPRMNRAIDESCGSDWSKIIKVGRTLEAELLATAARLDKTARERDELKRKLGEGPARVQELSRQLTTLQTQLAEAKKLQKHTVENMKFWENAHTDIKSQLAAAQRGREEAEKERDEAQEHVCEIIAAVHARIQGKLFFAYLHEQFPATIGHIPLRDWITNLGGACVSTYESKLEPMRALLRQTEAERDEARAMVCEAYSKTANHLRWARPHPMQFNVANGSLLRSIDAIFSQLKS